MTTGIFIRIFQLCIFNKGYNNLITRIITRQSNYKIKLVQLKFISPQLTFVQSRKYAEINDFTMKQGYNNEWSIRVQTCIQYNNRGKYVFNSAKKNTVAFSLGLNIHKMHITGRAKRGQALFRVC